MILCNASMPNQSFALGPNMVLTTDSMGCVEVEDKDASAALISSGFAFVNRVIEEKVEEPATTEPTTEFKRSRKRS
jgi:hypothetical protein